MNVLAANPSNYTLEKDNKLTKTNAHDIHTSFHSLFLSQQTTSNKNEVVQAENEVDQAENDMNSDSMLVENAELMKEILNNSDEPFLNEENKEETPDQLIIESNSVGESETENGIIISPDLEVDNKIVEESEIETRKLESSEGSEDYYTDAKLIEDSDVDSLDDLANINNAFYHELVLLSKDIAKLINEHTGSIQPSEKASRLFTILQNWDIWKQKIGESELSKIMTEELSDKEVKIWHQLVTINESRAHFTNKQVYQAESSISKADVLKWLQQAINLYQEPKESVKVGVSSSQAIPISEVEQYTVHVNQLQRIERVSDELIDKLQNIIKGSRFIQTPQMGNQLSIQLRPENLGNITVRLMQIDGELTVKIIVTSQATREILESNIHQLKHMFSPHQVLIERDETISDEEYLYKEPDEKNQDDEETSEQNYDSENNKDEKSSESDFNDWLERVSEGVFE